MPRIMVVDDDREMLKLLVQVLKTRPSLDVRAFSRPAAALESVTHHPVDLVIADYAMPGMDGISFLREFKIKCPAAARIMLSGRCDKHLLYSAINEAHAVRFIEKPVDPVALIKIVEEVLQDRPTTSGTTQQELYYEIRDRDMVIESQTKALSRLKAREKG